MPNSCAIAVEARDADIGVTPAADHRATIGGHRAREHAGHMDLPVAPHRHIVAIGAMRDGARCGPHPAGGACRCAQRSEEPVVMHTGDRACDPTGEYRAVVAVPGDVHAAAMHGHPVAFCVRVARVVDHLHPDGRAAEAHCRGEQRVHARGARACERGAQAALPRQVLPWVPPTTYTFEASAAMRSVRMSSLDEPVSDHCKVPLRL